MKTIGIIMIVALCMLTSQAQSQIPLIGSKAPSFTANTTNGKLTFPEDFGKSWKILLSHPGDFTPVCTSEILQLANMQKEFEKVNTKIALVSVEDVPMHNMWKKSVEDIKQEGKDPVSIQFPIIGDKDVKVSRLYGMMHNPANSVKDIRGVFIIDQDNIVQSINFYPMNVGRNMDELLRIIVALQTSKEMQVLMPANWNKGKDVLMPFKPYGDEELANNPDLSKEYYPIGISMWYKKITE